MEPISHEPLSTPLASENNDHRLRRVGDGAMVLEPRYDARAILGGGAVFAVLGAVVFAICRLFETPGPTRLWVAAIFLAGALGWIIVLSLVAPLWTRARFDRKQRTIALSGWRFSKRPTLSMDNVTALQLCGPVKHFDWDSYQLNLVLAPGVSQEGRANLLDNGDLAALRQMGTELAVLIGVPLLDHAGETEDEARRRCHKDFTGK